MADKLTQQIIDALTRVAAEPVGLPLYGSKADAGLFPNTAGAKPAAQKCLADELVAPVASDARTRAPRERFTLTEKGWEFLLAAVNPKQVLEDFVRVLEARQGEVGELLDTARRMADSLQGLRDAVARVLPGVSAARVVAKPTASAEPTPQPPPCREGVNSGQASWGHSDGTELRRSFSPLPGQDGVTGGTRGGFTLPNGRGVGGVGPTAAGRGPSARWQEDSPEFTPLPAGRETEAVGPAPPDLAPAVCAYLADHTGPTDCPLPELFRALALTDGPTIGQFHDCLRKLYSDGTVAFTAWAGPLYALPEPQYALMIGHGIAYYASLK